MLGLLEVGGCYGKMAETQAIPKKIKKETNMLAYGLYRSEDRGGPKGWRRVWKKQARARVRHWLRHYLMGGE
jgi:hypothetical protein